MKFLRVMLFLLIAFMAGCSETNPFKWHPMDIAPAAWLEDRSLEPEGSSGPA